MTSEVHYLCLPALGSKVHATTLDGEKSGVLLLLFSGGGGVPKQDFPV